MPKQISKKIEEIKKEDNPELDKVLEVSVLPTSQIGCTHTSVDCMIGTNTVHEKDANQIFNIFSNQSVTVQDNFEQAFINNFGLPKSDSINRMIFDTQPILIRGDSIIGMEELNDMTFNNQMIDQRIDIELNSTRRLDQDTSTQCPQKYESTDIH